MAARHLTVEVYNPSPQPNGAPVISTTGGTIGAYANLSFAVVANYQPYNGRGDADWFGVDRSTRVAHVWDGLTTTGTTNKITFPITPPMVQVSPAYHPVYPRSYLVLVQQAANFDFSSPAGLILETFNSTVTSLVLEDDTVIDTMILPAAEQIIISPVTHVSFKEREMTTVLHNGYVAGKSLTNFADIEQLDIYFAGKSISHADANRFKKWRQTGHIHVRITDVASGDEDTDPYTNIYEGKIIGSNYSNSLGKDVEPEFMISVAIYNTQVSSGVEINSTEPPE